MNSIQYITNQVGRVIGTPLQSRSQSSDSLSALSGSTAETTKEQDGSSSSLNYSNDSSSFTKSPIATTRRVTRSMGLQPPLAVASTETTKERAGIIQGPQELNEISESLNRSKLTTSSFDVEDTEPDEPQYHNGLPDQDYEVRTIEEENALVFALLYIPRLLINIMLAPFFWIISLFKGNRQAQSSSISDPSPVSNADRSAYLSILMLFIRPFISSSTPQPSDGSSVATEHKKEAAYLYDVLEEESGTISRNPRSKYSGFRPPLPGAHNKPPVTPTGPTNPRLYKTKSPSSYALRYPRQLAPPRPLLPSSVPLSPQNGLNEKKTLVLDLDETLIHSLFRTSVGYGQGHMIEVKLLNNHTLTLLSVLKRPYCHEFLDAVSQWYNLVVYTASVQSYADPVIDWLEKDRKYFSRRFYRQHCSFHSPAATPNNEPVAPLWTPTQVADPQPAAAAGEDLGVSAAPPGRPPKTFGYVKDLGQVEANLANVLIIDNSPIEFKNHVSNAIEIETWINDPSDTCLLSLIPMLSALRFTTDVRTVLSLKSGEAMFA